MSGTVNLQEPGFDFVDWSTDIEPTRADNGKVFRATVSSIGATLRYSNFRTRDVVGFTVAASLQVDTITVPSGEKINGVDGGTLRLFREPSDITWCTYQGASIGWLAYGQFVRSV